MIRKEDWKITFFKILPGRETSIYFAIELNLREISFVVYVHVLICAR